MESRRRKRKKKSGGIFTPLTKGPDGPGVYFIPIVIVFVIGFVLFRPNPNEGDEGKLEEANKLMEQYSAIPDKTYISPEDLDGEKILVAEEADGTLEVRNPIEIVSLSNLDIVNEKMDFRNPLLGFWRPTIGGNKENIRLRFTDTFTCEVYQVIDPDKGDYATSNLRKLSQVPFGLEGEDQLASWQYDGKRFRLPDFSMVLRHEYTNRDGSKGETITNIPVPMRLSTKGSTTPSDMDDFIEYSFVSRELNTHMLTQILKIHSIPMLLNTQWSRVIEADWRNGVDASKLH